MKKDKKPMPEWLETTLIIGGIFLFVVIVSTIEYLAIINTAGTENAYVPSDIDFMIKLHNLIAEHLTEQQMNVLEIISTTILGIIIGGTILIFIITIIKERRCKREGTNPR